MEVEEVEREAVSHDIVRVRPRARRHLGADAITPERADHSVRLLD
jgi:hypothetical protein